MDFGRSDDPAVQAQLDRLAQLSVPEGRFGLQTINVLMDRLGNPHRKLPPVFHVAGTNGKGSVCAFLRAILEADGKSVHVTTSPHLVRYNERIRVAGELISDDDLARLLEEVLDVSSDLGPSFFEVTIAAAFLAFSRTPADACIVEVGLGGRFDATNVLEPAAVAVSGIAALGLDHERFLLAPEEGTPDIPMARIAFEKAGIAKAGVPLVTMGKSYPPESQEAIQNMANSAGAVLRSMGDHWDCTPCQNDFYFEDAKTAGPPEILPNPRLPGEHQIGNAGLAVAILRTQSDIHVGEQAIQTGLQQASWPARMQKLAEGPLTVLASGHTVWLDGGHNPSAGQQVADLLQDWSVHLILGMLDNKDPTAITAPLGDRVRSLSIVPIVGHEAHPASAFGPDAVARENLEDALLNVPDDGYPILIGGSLYLAGEALRLNDEIPD